MFTFKFKQSLKSVISSTKSSMTSRKWFSVLKNTEPNPGKVVFISQSNDVYHNLAFEDWLYKNWTFEKRYVLFLWQNSPCVVIGRHQNPYVEANLPYLETAKVPVVRRYSGGGTVYHDEGNLNCTFFTPRQRHDRRWNLSLICESLWKDFGINIQLNSRDDLVTSHNLKISGTAAKLGRLSAYHHCTVLVNVNKDQLSLALKGDKSIKSKATASVPAPVANLSESYSDLTVEKLLASIGQHYLTKNLNPSISKSPTDCYRQSDGFTLINPTNDWFPGLDSSVEELKSWKWFHGMTPSFTVTRPVYLQESQMANVTIEAYHGNIKRVSLEKNFFISQETFQKKIESTFVGLPYSEQSFTDIEYSLCYGDQLQEPNIKSS